MVLYNTEHNIYVNFTCTLCLTVLNGTAAMKDTREKDTFISVNAWEYKEKCICKGACFKISYITN
jgi:hypothetical protein